MQTANMTKCSCVLMGGVYRFCIDILINTDIVHIEVSVVIRKAVPSGSLGGRFKVIPLGQLKTPYGAEGGKA